MKKHKLIIIVVVIWAVNIVGWAYHYANVDDKGYPRVNRSHCTKDTLEMDYRVEPYFDAYIDDCKVHDIKYDHVYCLHYLGMGRSSVDQGETDFNDNTIFINKNLLDDTIGLKFVIYHELGHWLGLHHSRSGIMKQTYNKDDQQEVQDNWDNLREEYFTNLKKKTNS